MTLFASRGGLCPIYSFYISASDWPDPDHFLFFAFQLPTSQALKSHLLLVAAILDIQTQNIFVIVQSSFGQSWTRREGGLNIYFIYSEVMILESEYIF